MLALSWSLAARLHGEGEDGRRRDAMTKRQFCAVTRDTGVNCEVESSDRQMFWTLLDTWIIPISEAATIALYLSSEALTKQWNVHAVETVRKPAMRGRRSAADAKRCEETAEKR